MSKKNKNNYSAVKMNQADLDALERRGIDTGNLSHQMEEESVYFLAKEKKDEEGRAYLKPWTENGKLMIAAVPKVKAHDKFEKLAIQYESACIVSGIFSCQEYVDKVSKPKMDDLFKKRKLEADFSNTTVFDELLFSDLDKQAEFFDQVKRAGKKAMAIEKKGISNFKEIDDLWADEEFDLASRAGCGRCITSPMFRNSVEQAGYEEEDPGERSIEEENTEEEYAEEEYDEEDLDEEPVEEDEEEFEDEEEEEDDYEL